MSVAVGAGVDVGGKGVDVGGTGVGEGVGVGIACTFTVTDTVSEPALEVIPIAPINVSTGAESLILKKISPSPITDEEGSINSSHSGTSVTDHLKVPKAVFLTVSLASKMSPWFIVPKSIDKGEIVNFGCLLPLLISNPCLTSI